MVYRWINNKEEFQYIAKQWDNAIFLSNEDNPFLLSDFILTWWKYYSKNFKLQILVLYQNGHIIGGLPLYQKKNGYLEYIGGITANYTEFLSLEDNQSVWDAFFKASKHIKDWRCIYIKRLRKDKLNIGELKSIASKHKNILFDIYSSDYGYLINIPENLSDFLKSIPKKLRYYVKRSEKELSKLGKISLNSIKNCAEVNELCNKYVDLSRSSFKRRKKQSAFEDKTFCMFFKELINKFCNAGYLDAHMLKLDERIIAIHFGYSICNNLNYIFPTFDMDFAPYNPGHLLIYKLIELGSRRKSKLFNLYTGGHLYKKQWSDRNEEIVSVEIRPNSIRGNIERRISKQIRTSSIANKTKETIRSSPILMNIGKKIERLLQNYV